MSHGPARPYQYGLRPSTPSLPRQLLAENVAGQGAENLARRSEIALLVGASTRRAGWRRPDDSRCSAPITDLSGSPPTWPNIDRGPRRVGKTQPTSTVRAHGQTRVQLTIRRCRMSGSASPRRRWPFGPPSVSRLSAAIPHAASRGTAKPCPGTSMSRTDAVASKAAEGRVKWCGWHGMQGVRGSNPLSSTPGQRPSPPSTAPESRRSRSRCAATASAWPTRSSRAAVTRASIAGVVSR
jgi:hypothetical protein